MTFNRFIIIAVLILMPLFASAQKLGMTDRLGGTYVVTFTVPEGQVKVFLPDDISGGDTVSAAVFTYPKTGSGALLKSYKIHTDYKSAPISGGSLTLEIPRNMSGSSLRVTLRDAENREISYSSAAVKVPDAFADRPETPNAFDFETPLIGQSGRLAEISGPFDGDFSTTSLSIGASPAHIISESPRKLVFEVPADLPGQAEIVLIENGVTVKRPFTALRVVKIGENDTSASASIVPEGYSARQQPREVNIDEVVTTEVIEEEVVVARETTDQGSGLIEEKLDINTTEVQSEEIVEKPSTMPEASPSLDVAQILQAQLNLPLEGASKLVSSEQIDTVVVRELDITEKPGLEGQTELKVHEEEIIEEEIVVEQKIDTTPSVETPGSQDASESSRDLIERIYKSTRGDLEETPGEFSQPKETAKTKRASENISYGEKGKYTVQVASFRDRASADSLSRELERKGYNVRVTEADVPGKGRWLRVSVGSFDTKPQAKAYGERLKSRERSIKTVYITRIQ